jgi:hypothetical protein
MPLKFLKTSLGTSPLRVILKSNTTPFMGALYCQSRVARRNLTSALSQNRT